MPDHTELPDLLAIEASLRDGTAEDIAKLLETYRGAHSFSSTSAGDTSFSSPRELEPVHTHFSTPAWVKSIIPIVLSAIVSAGCTGIVTVVSIKQELAVQTASTNLRLDDHTRRISELETKVLSREAIAERDRRVDDAFKNLQEQVGRTDMNVDEMRRIIYERFGKR